MPLETEFRIAKSEIEIEFYRSSGPGGQHKNKTATAVRIRHIPTGIVVHASERRSQLQNRKMAIERLISALAKRAFKPKKRIPIKISEAQKTKRLEEKKRTAAKKALRRMREEGLL
jgi:protein subunit release factor B